MKKGLLFLIILSRLLSFHLSAQVSWTNVDSLYQPLPPAVHVYYTNDSLGHRPNIAFYVKVSLKSDEVYLDVDTALNRGLTPSAYFERNSRPFVVTNCTFFSPEHRNINVVVDEGKMVSCNLKSVYVKTDSLYHYVTRSAIGINRHGKTDVAWVLTDSVKGRAFEMCSGPVTCTGNERYPGLKDLKKKCQGGKGRWKKPWRMETAVGGGPMLITGGNITITNEEERMFMGKAINDRHPRTAMGYTPSGELIILSVQGRFPGKAEGATLIQEAQLLQELGCIEALNLDGGGSSCLLVNGKQTITPSDKTGQRQVPAVFMVKARRGSGK